MFQPRLCEIYYDVNAVQCFCCSFLKKSIGRINRFIGKKDESHRLIVRKSAFCRPLFMNNAFAAVSKYGGLSNGFYPCRAVGKWSMEEHLWYLFVAGVTAGCSCRGKVGPLSPTVSPYWLSEWVVRLVRLPEYFIVALQVLPKGLLPQIDHLFQH